MAESSTVGIEDTWANLRSNPVFRRELLPRGFRSIIRSPIVRAVLLTAAALGAYQGVLSIFLRVPFLGVVAFAILFWFLIEAMQRYFCWMELSALSASGNLDDYLNSGLSREDVTIGVIYPAIISEVIAVSGVIIFFLLTTQDHLIQILLVVVIFLHVGRLFKPPFLFLPDVESYLRKRNPITLFFISIAVFVPLLIWFVIFYAFRYGMSFVAGILRLGIPPNTILIAAFLATYFLSQYPTTWWNIWRLKRFYRRYASFDDLFERYFEQRSGE